MKIFISPDGTEITSVYDDAIPKEKLGTARTERASNVEFNAETQKWEAIKPDGSVMCSDANRGECLRQEKIIVEKMLLDLMSK